MIAESLKSKIFKIIPEYSFLMKAIKKNYGSLLYLKFLLSKKSSRTLSKIITKFIAEQKKDLKSFLDISSNGNEMFYLKSIENLFNSADAPNIIYKIDSRRTKKFGYHPVEIMWLLDARGYSFFVLDESGEVIPRKSREYEGIIVAIKPKL